MRALDPVDQSGVAVSDDVTAWLVYSAVDTLIEMRFGAIERDAGAVVAALESLALEAGSILGEVVADARGAGSSWEEIATWLSIGVSAAQQRYG